MPNRDEHLRRALILCFALSGFCGLLYEVLWMRVLSSVLGNTLFATSLVLSAFMGGLAAGGYLFGRWANRWSGPSELLRVYALLELGIGLWALLLPWSHARLPSLWASLFSMMTPKTFALIECVVGALLLLPPTIFMGGTLPVLGAFFGREHFERLGGDIGRLYAANTFGAALGSASAGFFLIPALGLRRSHEMAAAVNLLIAALVWGLTRACSSSDEAKAFSQEETAGQRIAPAPPDSRAGSSLLLIFFLSGFIALLYEVTYTRVLALLWGPTVYGFSAMLTLFILGLALGSRLSALRADRWSAQKARGVLAGLYIASGAAVAATLPLLNHLPIFVGEIARTYADDYVRLQLFQVLMIAGLLLIPTTLWGAAFPLIVKLYVQEREILSERLGRALAANTLGAVGGSLLTGFLLIPRLGIERTFWTGILLGAGIGGALFLGFPLSRWVRAGLAVIPSGLLLLLLALLPRWDMERLLAGTYKYAPYYENLDVDVMAHRGELLFHKEGAIATVAVRRVGAEHWLSLDGKVDASDGGADMLTQKLLAHLPLLIADSPRHIGILGLGSGVTVGAALKHPVQEVEVLEISPEVVQASRFFEHVNERALQDPRVRLILGDGRKHLLLTTRAYDVFISEPSNPWMAGMGALFTREFFERVRERLSERGIVCQWLHSYNMSLRDLKIVLRTFHSVFPRAFLWALNENDLLLLGAKDPAFDLDLERIARRVQYPAVREDLRRLGCQDLYALLSLYVMHGEDIERLTRGVPLHTDDHPLLEFSSPRFMHAQTSLSNFRALLEFSRSLPPPRAVREVLERATWEHFQNKGRMYEQAESFALAFREYRRAIERNPRAREALDGLRRVARTREHREEAKRIYEGLLAQDANNEEARLALAAWYEEEQRYPECLALFQDAPLRIPEETRALERQAACAAGAQEPTLLEAICRRWLRADPRSGLARFYLALARFHQREWNDALRLVQESRRADPRHFQAHTLLAMIYAEMGQTRHAEATFQEILRLHPHQTLAYYNYGLFLLNAGRWEDARENFRKALDQDPSHLESYLGLAEASRRGGQREEARRWAERALRLDPHNTFAREILRSP